ncbi:MAG TPA: hypothetical protein VHC22_22610 [Pirellulales bacterium]|nr:hypothetical protein [Pirellulales bacterium]
MSYPMEQLDAKNGSTDFYYWLILLPLALLNFLLPPLAKSSEAVWLVALLGGLLLGEWNWLATWAALGPTRWTIRFVEVAIGVVALGGSLLLSVAALEGGSLRDLGEIVLVVPLCLVATQAPLWLFRLAAGWRITAIRYQTPDRGDDDARRFGLTHLFAATALLAVSLGAARAASVPVGALLILIAVMPILNVFVTLPSIYTGLVMDDTTKANQSMLVYMLAIPSLVAGGMGVYLAGPFWELWLPMCCLATAPGVLHGGLRLMRADGYRLARRPTSPNRPADD